MADKKTINQQEIYDYLISKGVSDKHAVGMLANMLAESKFQPGVEGDFMIPDSGNLLNKERIVFQRSDGSWYYWRKHPTLANQTVEPELVDQIETTSGGLFQHHASRFDAMVNTVGEDWKTDWKGQIDFALSEREGQTYINTAVADSTDATKKFAIGFERMAGGEDSANERVANIKELNINPNTIPGTEAPDADNDGVPNLLDLDTQATLSQERLNEIAQFAPQGPPAQQSIVSEDTNRFNKDAKELFNSMGSFTPGGRITTGETRNTPEVVNAILSKYKNASDFKSLEEAYNKIYLESGSVSDLLGEDPGKKVTFAEGLRGEFSGQERLVKRLKGLAEGEEGLSLLELDLKDEGTEYASSNPDVSRAEGNSMFQNPFKNYIDAKKDFPEVVTEAIIPEPETVLLPEGETDDSAIPTETTTLPPVVPTEIDEETETDAATEVQDDRETRAPFELERAGLFEQIGGISTLVAGLFAKKGMKEAMKEINIPNTPGLSQAFKRHFYESEQLAKSGMSLAEQQAVQQNIDGAYKEGVENMVRGTSGDRAKFLASLGVLDSQRQSSLLKAAAVNDDIKRKNRGAFQKALFFKEEFEANKSTAERNEELSEALATKAGYAQMGSNAMKTIMDNMTAAKTYGTGSPMDKYMQMQMYNMGVDSSEKRGTLPLMFQGVQNWFQSQRNQSSLVPQQEVTTDITEE